MKLRPILLFFISIVFTLPALAQDKNKNPLDTVPKIDKYGLRVGVDLAKPLRTLLEDGYSGIELLGDVRISKKFYVAAELGNEQKDWNEPYVSAKTSGSYAKVGFDYNTYDNWTGMDNAISVGLRYGFSTFKQDLLNYRIYTSNPIFPSEVIYAPQTYSGLTAHWAELILSIKTEVFTNLYVSLNAQLKLKLSEQQPDNFSNLYIPGFNRTYDYSDFGVGYGYSISYRIPIFKKERSVKKDKE